MAVELATVGAAGFDCLAPIRDRAPDLSAAGYAFAVRYIGLSADSSNLHPDEVRAILDAGLALMLVQQGAGWHDRSPSAALGDRHGRAAVEGAQRVGYPASAVLWLDLESVGDATSDEVRSYAEAWFEAVAGDYSPGLYVGPGIGLTDAELGALSFRHYWRSGATQRSPADTPYAVTQHPPVEVAGHRVDEDRIVQPVPWARSARPRD